MVFVEPYFHNLGKRIIKRPKIYFWDTGLVCYLTGIRTTEILEKGPLCGPIFENYLIAEINKTIQHQKKDNKFFYFRSNSGLEADLIIEDRKNRKINFIEIKYNSTARPVMVENLKKLMEKETEYQVNIGYEIDGLLLYSGNKTGKYFGSITFLRWYSFLEQYSSRE